jgi:hypothetical protein
MKTVIIAISLLALVSVVLLQGPNANFAQATCDQYTGQKRLRCIAQKQMAVAKFKIAPQMALRDDARRRQKGQARAREAGLMLADPDRPAQSRHNNDYSQGSEGQNGFSSSGNVLSWRHRKYNY